MTAFKLIVGAIATLMVVVAFSQPGMGAHGLGVGQAIAIYKGPTHAVISGAILALALLLLHFHDFPRK
jgi:hypothetical protein